MTPCSVIGGYRHITWTYSNTCLLPDYTASQTLSSSLQYVPKFVILVKVKQSHYRPGEALRVPVGWGSQISRQSAHEGGKVVSPTHRPPLPRRKYTWYSFLLDWVDPRATVWPEGLCQWKIPKIPTGIEPATYRIEARCLNRLSHRVPPWRLQALKVPKQCCSPKPERR